MTSTQLTQDEWSLMYYRKKAQFNQYQQFKTKSFQYQKFFGKLHFLSFENNQTNIKQTKHLVKTLNSTFEELKNIFSCKLDFITEIHEEMRFMKLNNISLLVQSCEQLFSSVHHYTIQDFRKRLEYVNSVTRQGQYSSEKSMCQKCQSSINHMNIKKLYDQITITETSFQDDNNKISKQDRRKLISQLDQFDILLAQKENYIKKVNALLENKGKVGQLSQHDKTYNFLSEYLSTIQKIQERKHKSYKKSDPDAEVEERKWEEESYKHILEYIKRVLFQHFVNECSGPVKKIFQKINFDKIFKSFEDHKGMGGMQERSTLMQNKETQTATIPQVEQLKNLQKKMEFKLKQASILKSNKDELERKYLSVLDNNRKVQSQLFEVKKQKKWSESQMNAARQNLKQNLNQLRNFTQKYNESVGNHEQDKKKIIQLYVMERQKILKTSKHFQSQFHALQAEHKKCEAQRVKTKLIQLINQQVQTDSEQFGRFDNDLEIFSVGDSKGVKNRRSKMKKLLFGMKNEKRNAIFMKDVDKGQLIENRKKQNIPSQSSHEDSIRSQINLQIQSNLVNIIVKPFSQSLNNDSKVSIAKHKKQGNNFSKDDSKLNTKQKPSPTKIKNSLEQQFFSRIATQSDELKQHPKLQKDKQKMNMKSLKKIQKLKTNQTQYYTEQLSDFNRQTEHIQKQKNKIYNVTVSEEFNITNKSKQRREKSIKQPRNHQEVTERLYRRRKRKNSKESPFQRVIENGKERFYIKKISRQSINYKLQKEKIKEISQILKPYVYSHNNQPAPTKKRVSKTNLKTLRQQITELSQRRHSTVRNEQLCGIVQSANGKEQNTNSAKRSRVNSQQPNIKTYSKIKIISNDIISVQNIVQSQYAYLKAVGFIDFLLKIGKQNKKMVKAINKIQNEVKDKFRTPNENDLQLFGGLNEAEDYIKGKNYWNAENLKENMMIYNKNDGLSLKVQKYFNLLKRANPQVYGVLMRFLVNPIFAVYGNKDESRSEVPIRQDGNFTRDLFNQLQKYHKIKHNQCTHIIDFLQKIGFYRYTYF